MYLLESFPILLFDDELHDDTAAGRATRALVDRLRADGSEIITSTDIDDAEQIVASTHTLSAVLVDWDIHHSEEAGGGSATATLTRAPATARLIEHARAHSQWLPIFVLADRSSVDELPIDLLRQINGYIWKLEDTPKFVARRIEEARREYVEQLLPPFFDALVRFTEDAAYSWHTPGHSGGAAFLKTPVGSAFHRFFGENTLRSDLSVSAGELGSLLEHTGPVGRAEAEAARTFGADRTMFVTNGTSTANKIVFHACVRPGDVVLVDRNCHKSVMHAIVMTGAVPVYLPPTRNAYGIIGPIPPTRLGRQAVQAAMARSPLVPAGVADAALAVITNSTYDGLCYDADAVLRSLGQSSKRVLFDEAWFGYAHFHPLYARRYGMGVPHQSGQPATFSTQSTHKLLSAFSQASMIHLHDADNLVPAAALEEAFMMHTSTSPQYGIIASLDVATRMMEGPQGVALIEDAISEALAFRAELTAAADACDPEDWCFRPWQPPGALDGDDDARRDPLHWVLRTGDAWHGYADPGDGHVMLDPIKVTILTPGIGPDGRLEKHGIPASLVSRFLDEHGIVVEKTGSYSLLVLFSMGITKGKAGTLLAELLEFKRLYDGDAPLALAMPRLVSEHRDRYGTMTLRELAEELHQEMREARINELSEGMYAQLPEQVMIPQAAYHSLVDAAAEMVPVDSLQSRVSTVMLVPYPPGIPVIMPGERFPNGGMLLPYLTACERLGRRFPGFETEIHGVHVEADGSFTVPCVPAGR